MKNILVKIGGLAGLVAIIGLLIAALQLWQSVADSREQSQALATMLASQANANATAVYILEQQLKVQGDIATLQAGNANQNPTIVAQQIQELESTAVALETTKKALEATATARVLLPVVASDPVLSSIKIDNIANFQFDHFVTPFVGNISLSEIPFYFSASKQSIFQSQRALLPNLETSARVRVNIPRVTKVYLLLNADYLSPEISGKKVGEVNLQFSNNLTHSISIIAWQNIRAVVVSENDAYIMDNLLAPQSNNELINVWIEKQNRGNAPYLAYTDMLIIPIPEIFQGEVLKDINIIDTSTDTVGSYDPSLVLIGITVESR